MSATHQNRVRSAGAAATATSSPYESILRKARALQEENRRASISPHRFAASSASSIGGKSAAAAAIEEAQRALLTQELKQQALEAYVTAASAKLIAELRVEKEREVLAALREELRPVVVRELVDDADIRAEARAAAVQALRQELREEVRAELLADEYVEVFGYGERREASASLSSSSKRVKSDGGSQRRESHSSNSVIRPGLAGEHVDLSQDSGDESDRMVKERPRRPVTRSSQVHGKRTRKDIDDEDQDGLDSEMPQGRKKRLTEALLQAAETKADDDTDAADGLAKFGTYAKYAGEENDDDEEEEDDDEEEEVEGEIEGEEEDDADEQGENGVDGYNEDEEEEGYIEEDEVEPETVVGRARSEGSLEDDEDDGLDYPEEEGSGQSEGFESEDYDEAGNEYDDGDEESGESSGGGPGAVSQVSQVSEVIDLSSDD